MLDILELPSAGMDFRPSNTQTGQIRNRNERRLTGCTACDRSICCSVCAYAGCFAGKRGAKLRTKPSGRLVRTAGHVKYIGAFVKIIMHRSVPRPRQLLLGPSVLSKQQAAVFASQSACPAAVRAAVPLSQKEPRVRGSPFLCPGAVRSGGCWAEQKQYRMQIG